MKELLKQYAAYNIWASQRLFDIVLATSEEQQHQELPSSFSSLYKTIFHMWDAESIWWQRMKLQEKITVPSKNFSGNMKDVMAGLTEQSKQWEGWVNTASDLAIEHVFQYQRLDGSQYKQPIWQMLLHVFNHATYHRGQVVNMLRQLGIEKIPSTDFATWAVGKK
jgi:uncharacterized damage-inducible protein DinB